MTNLLLRNKILNGLTGFALIAAVMVGPVSCDKPAEETPDLEKVRLSVNNKYPAIGETVQFEARHATGMTAVWDWGDGSEAGSGITATHSYSIPDLYTITLTVTYGGVDKVLTARAKVEGASLTDALADFDRSKIWIMAHRGNTGKSSIPENSVAAIEECVKSGAVDVVEIDPRVTKDGKIIIMHDDSIDRTTNGTGKVADLTYSQIQQYFLKLADGTITKHKVPTLEEILKAGRGKLYFDLDSKTDAGAMYKVVNDCGMRERVLFYTGTDTNLGTRLLAINNALHVYPYYSNESNVSYLYSYDREFFIQLDYTDVVSGKAATPDGKGFLVSANHLWDVDGNMNKGDYSTIDGMLGAGHVHMIQTDYANKLHAYLKSKGKR